jgi:hypothetical protein
MGLMENAAYVLVTFVHLFGADKECHVLGLQASTVPSRAEIISQFTASVLVAAADVLQKHGMSFA